MRTRILQLIGFLVLCLNLTVNAQVQISLQLDTFQRSIPTANFGGQTWRGPSWVNSVFNDSVATMYPDVLAFPPSPDLWDWENGWFYPQSFLDTCSVDTITLNWGQLNATVIDISPENFQSALNQIGAEGLYCLNMISSSMATQLESLRSAKANGVHLERIRLGDEMGKAGNAHSISQFPNAVDYALTCSAYIDSIRTILPNAKIAVSAGNFGGNSNPRAEYWNEALYDMTNTADAFRWSAFFYLKPSDSIFSTKQLLAYAFDQIPAYEKTRCFEDTTSNLQDYELWVGYGITDNTLDHRFLNRWSLVLMFSASHNLFLNNKLVEDISMFNIGGIFDNWEALDTQNGFRKRATGIFAAIWNKAKLDNSSATKIKTPITLIDSVTYYNNNSVPRNIKYPKLFAWRFENDSTFEASAILTNISEDTLIVSVDNLLVGDVYWEKWHSDSLFDLIDSINYISLIRDTGLIHIVLPPYSINVARGSFCGERNYTSQNNICHGDSLFVGNSVYTTPGHYTDTLSTVLGCDSIINTELVVYPSFSVNIIQNNDTLESNISESSSYSYLWNNGEMSPNIIASSIGSYWLIVTDTNNCNSDTVYITVSTLDTSCYTNFIDNLNIYPNPSSSELHVEFKSSKKVSIKILSIKGRVLYEKEVIPSNNINKVTLDLDPYAKGAYFIKLEAQNEEINYKIIHQ
ncbi:MAG: T9SS type A sorting domain-containing protein [Crocinitomicaceae bacterium]|nr:T9SS type A sorting domain-containing protein [Crocinitomicaceae bacterium]